MVRIEPYSLQYNRPLIVASSKGMGFTYVFGEELGILYTKYVLYTHLLYITEGYVLLDDDKFVGAILYDKYGSNRIFNDEDNRQRYDKFVSRLDGSLPEGFKEPVEKINAFIDDYFKKAKIDGVIMYFAIAEEYQNKGYGTILLNELIKNHKGESVSLMTDSNCTYQFYEHKGFDLIKKEVIPTPKQVDYTCFIYNRVL